MKLTIITNTMIILDFSFEHWNTVLFYTLSLTYACLNTIVLLCYFTHSIVHTFVHVLECSLHCHFTNSFYSVHIHWTSVLLFVLKQTECYAYLSKNKVCFHVH